MTCKAIIRPAREADAVAIVDVQRRSWAATYPPALVEKMLAQLNQSQHRLLWHKRLTDRAMSAWVVGERPLKGFACVEFTPDGPELLACYLDPTVTGQGLGARLLSKVEQHLSVNGESRLGLWVMMENERAINFYLRQGYQLTGQARQNSFDGERFGQLRAEKALIASKAAGVLC